MVRQKYNIGNYAQRMTKEANKSSTGYVEPKVQGIRGTGGPTATPNKIKCGICNKWKQSQNFSNRQLKMVSSHVRRNGQESGLASLNIACQSCMSGGNRMEWTCARCHECKDLDSFSKAQRGKGDQATCQTCIEEVLRFNPIDEIQARHRGSDDEESDSDDESDESDDGRTLTVSMTSLSLNSGQSSGLASAARGGAGGPAGQPELSVEQYLDDASIDDALSITSSRAEARALERGGGNNSDDDDGASVASSLGFDDSASQAGRSRKSAGPSGYQASVGTGRSRWAKVRAGDDRTDPNPPAPSQASFAAIRAAGNVAAIEHRNNSLYGGGVPKSEPSAWSGPTNKWGKPVRSSQQQTPFGSSAASSGNGAAGGGAGSAGRFGGAEPLPVSDSDDDDDDWGAEKQEYNSDSDEDY